MKEFLENPNFVEAQDAPRPYNKQLLIDIFDNWENWDQFENLGKYEEVLYIAGIGSGKSYISSMAIVYIIYRLLCLKNPQEYFHFAKGTKIAFINISKSFNQAKDIVFGEIKNRLDNNKWFQTFYPPDPRIKSKIRLPKNLFILPLGSNEEAPLGYNIFGAVIDEASFHTLTKEKDYAEESYNQIKKRIRSRFFSKGKLFIITSPRYVYDFAEKKFTESEDNPKVFRRRAALWEVMPPETFSGEKFDLGNYLPNMSGIMVPVEYEDEFRQNPELAMRDYGAQPSMAIQGFFNDPDVITRAANYNREHPIDPRTGDFHEWFFNSRSKKNYDSDKRFIHIDLGLNKEGKGDCAGLCMGKFAGWQEAKSIEGKNEKRPKIFIDFMLRIQAKTAKDEIQFEEVRQYIYRLKDIGYNIAKVTFDGWQCNLGSNKVRLINGTDKRIDKITSEEWLYSYDLNKNEIVSALCKAVIKTGIKVPVYEVQIDNGEKIHFTPEHLILLKNGSYKMVKDLQKGDSLMPLYTKISNRGFRNYKSQENHRVVSVKFYGYEDVYDIEVPKYHNFGLSAGIFVHNSVDSIQTLRSAGFNADFFSVDRNPEAYYTLKSALLDKRLDFYYYKPFVEELQQLEEIKGSKIDHPRRGSKDVCLTGDTKISLLNGTEIPIKDLVGKSGFEVYSVLSNGEIKIGEVEKVVYTGLRNDIFRIWLDNKKYIDCTSNHPFLLKNGRYKNAEELKIGDSLMPLYRKLSIGNSKTSLNGYEMVKDNKTEKWIYTHQLVGKQKLNADWKGKKTTRMVLHHIDFNKRNNSSNNLQWISWKEHRKIHCKNQSELQKQRWQNGVYTNRKKRMYDLETLEQFRQGRIIYNKSKERILKMQENGSFQKAGSITMQKLWQDEDFRKRHSKRVKERNQEAIRRGTHPFQYYPRNNRGWIIKLNNHNHKVVSIEKINKKTEVFDLIVKKYHNFALSAGVFVHNCDAVAGVCYQAAKGTPGRGFLGA